MNSLKSYPSALELWLGDMVVINEISGDWFRGYKVDEPDRLGIFPKCFIHLKPQRTLKIIDEAASSVTEWSKYLEKMYEYEKYDSVELKKQEVAVLINRVLELRRKLVSGSLTQAATAKIAQELAQHLDFGNAHLKAYGADHTVRGATMNVILPSEANPVQLYSKSRKSQKQMQNIIAEANHFHDGLESIRKAGNKDQNVKRQIYFRLVNALFKFGDEAEFNVCVAKADSLGRFHQISDNLLIRWSQVRINVNTDILSKGHLLRGLFMDLTNSELEDPNVLLIVTIVRVGQMDLKDAEKKQMSLFDGSSKASKNEGKTSGIRRPFGVTTISMKDVLSPTVKSDAIVSLKVFRFGNDEPFHRFIIRCVNHHFGRETNSSVSNMAQNTNLKELGQLLVSFCVLHGSLEHIKKANSELVGHQVGCQIVERRTFPDVIMPGLYRNDFYILLRSGNFEKSTKQARSVQVEMSVRVQDNVIPGTFAHGEFAVPCSHFRSHVYYMEKSPNWMEWVKMRIPVDEFKKAYVLFTFRHRSTTQSKDKSEQEFAFAFLPLKSHKSGTIQDNDYKVRIKVINLFDDDRDFFFFSNYYFIQ